MTSKDQATVAVVLKNVKKNIRNLKLPAILFYDITTDFILIPALS